MNNKTGRIFNIQYFCIQDGPGIRTTVFLKGCPLHCIWCHNPESLSQEKVLSFSERKCADCGLCTKVCSKVHKIIDGKHVMNREACSLKGNCVDACVTHALEIVGRDVTVDEIMTEVMREKLYYDNSKGGVTISGGEPALQPAFLLDLVKALKEKNVHVALETSGFARYEIYEAVLPYIDLFLYDYKESNPKLHKIFTGADNRLIKENLNKLYRDGAKIRLRCPIIPELNDREDHFQGIAELAKTLPNLEGVEILAYHKLAASKIDRMGLEEQKVYEQVPKETVDLWREKICAYGVQTIES